MKREPKFKLHEQPALAWRARFLLNVSTDTLFEYLDSPITKATRTFRSLVAAEVLYRMKIPYPFFHPILSRDESVYEIAWRLCHGDAPIPRGWGPPSVACPHERAWVSL